MASTGGVAPGSRAATPHLSYGYMKRSTREASTEEGELIQCITERLKKRVEEDGEVTWCGVGLWGNTSPSLDGDGSPPCQVRRDVGCEGGEGHTEADGTKKNVTEELKHVEEETSVQGKPTVRTAWLSAAMAWRQKNMPSASELKQRREEVSRRISEAARMRNNAREQQRESMKMSVPKSVEQKQPVMPDEDATESEWKAYFRMYHTLRIADASSFVQVLRAFNVPCSDPKKIKTAYMQAVRMYHPDSNSKSRKWSSARGKAEAEEIMKLINSRKPEGFQ